MITLGIVDPGPVPFQIEWIHGGMSKDEMSSAAHACLEVIRSWQQPDSIRPMPGRTMACVKRPLGTSKPGASYWSLEGMLLRSLVWVKDIWDGVMQYGRMLCGR